MFYGDGSELDKFEMAMEAAGLAWWWMELPSGAVFFSPHKSRMIGHDSKDFVHYEDFMNLVHPDDRDKAMSAMRSHLDGKESHYEVVYRIKHKNGKYVEFYDRGKIVGRKGNDILVAGMVFDLNEYSNPFLKRKKKK